jgi:general secretion pathway protein A
MSHCHRIAFHRLNRDYEKARPVVVLTGEGSIGASQVISSFLSNLEDNADVIRISEQCIDAIGFMREVVRAIDFKPKELNLGDLENIFTMFLSYQKTHRRRTIVSIEEADNHGWWVLDKICRLIEMEKRRKQGLMVILSGQSNLAKLLYKPPLDAIAVDAGQRVSLAPFTSAETRAFIRQRVETAGITDIGKVFDYQAITLIHEMSGGVPDVISSICCKCLQLVNRSKPVLVTTDLVTEANRLFQCATMSLATGSNGDPERVAGDARSLGRLVARINGEVVREIPVDTGRILIGRDQLSEICLASNLVSRHHALIFNSKYGLKLADLGSTNGTFVHGHRISQYTLEDNDVIAIGDCLIEYVASNNYEAGSGELERTDNLDLQYAPKVSSFSVVGL